MRQQGSDSGAAIPEVYVPIPMDLRYAPGEGPSRSPKPGWALEVHEAEALREPLQGSTDIFDSDNHWVQLTPQGACLR